MVLLMMCLLKISSISHMAGSWKDTFLMDVCRISEAHHKPNAKTQILLLPRIYYKKYFSYTNLTCSIPYMKTGI